MQEEQVQAQIFNFNEYKIKGDEIITNFSAVPLLILSVAYNKQGEFLGFQVVHHPIVKIL